MVEMSEREELLQIFMSEAEELLKQAETSLMSLDADPRSSLDLDELFRSIHTLKSSAAMVGFIGVSEYSHLLETLMERLRSKKLAITKSLITSLLDSVDLIRTMVDRACRGEAEADLKVLGAHREQIMRYLGLEVAPPSPDPPPRPVRKPMDEQPQGPATYKIDLRFRKDIFYTGRDPLPVLLSLSRLGELVRVTADLSELPDFDRLRPYDLYISWRLIFRTDRPGSEIEDALTFVREDNDIRIEDVTSRYRDGVDLDLADKKLGEVLIERGDITRDVLANALSRQKKLGEILVDEGRIGSSDLREIVAEQEESRALYRKTTIRVSVEKIDNLVNLAEEMGVSLARLQTFLNRLEDPARLDIGGEMEYLIKVNREFQDRVARVRMFPLEGTFRRFQRMVRDLAYQQNKQIRIAIAGIDTELDKEVIEHITDPLKHLVRNCVDHGIEMPEERIARGKPAEGVIEFRAYQKEGKIFIEISDDGRGIDSEAIRRKAFQEGIIPSDGEMSKEAMLDVLFKPGFSTTSMVTELSGRGVGMNVVKTHMDQLGGFIDVRTEKGAGTTFVLSLPLRFALMEALHVKVKDMSFLIPMQSILGTERFQEDLLKDVGAAGRLYRFRGDYVPLVDLTEVLDLRTDTSSEASSVLIFMDTGKRVFGVSVAEILEPQQIIIKSLESNYRNIKSLTGAAIMGDGSVSLVLDLLGLDEIVFKR
jgi:two-component system, chemotaxis family, sensor kinase CheA